MGLRKACELSDLEEGEIFKAEVEGHPAIAVFMVDGDVFATADLCTHGEASLSDDGYVEDGKVICSWHDGAFDIRTGEACHLPCLDALQTFPILIENGEVFLQL